MAEKFEPADWDSRHQEDRKPRKRVEEDCSEHSGRVRRQSREAAAGGSSRLCHSCGL